MFTYHDLKSVSTLMSCFLPHFPAKWMTLAYISVLAIESACIYTRYTVQNTGDNRLEDSFMEPCERRSRRSDISEERLEAVPTKCRTG